MMSKLNLIDMTETSKDFIKKFKDKQKKQKEDQEMMMKMTGNEDKI